MSNILSAEEMTISEYLKLNDNKPILNIPFSQRPYVWSQKELNRFWDDLISVYKKNEEQHILNFFTIYGDKSNVSSFIYDGQQRSVTSVIFLCSIANMYKELYEETKDEEFISGHDSIKKQYIINVPRFGVNKGKKNITIKFDSKKLNDFFEEYIVEGKEYDKKIELKGENEKNLLQAYAFFKEHIKSLISEFNKNIEKVNILDELVDSLLSRFIIVVLTTKDKSVAERMFNSLNTAGKELDMFYIIKNECVGVLGENTVKANWMDIEMNLVDLSKDKFLMYFSNAHFGKISKNEDIVDKIKRTFIKDTNSTNIFINDLLEASKWYSFCRDSQNDELFDGKLNEQLLNELKKSIDILDGQQITSYIPVIFAMVLKKFTIDSIIKTLKQIESLMIRNKIIIGQSAQIFNNFYNELAYEIFNNNLSEKEIVQRIELKKSTDKEIMDYLMMPFKRKSFTLRTILIELVDMECTDVKTRSEINYVNLEHIAPKTLSDEWEKDSGDDIEEYVHHIGNLTLISTPINCSIKNKRFIEKKKIYTDSNIKMTRDIGNLKTNVWTKDNIIERSKYISELILKRWPKNNAGI